MLIFFRRECIPDHLYADECKEPESDPMIIGLDTVLEIMDGQPAQKAIREKLPHLIFRTITPLTIDMVKQSIARATEMSNISQSVII